MQSYSSYDHDRLNIRCGQTVWLVVVGEGNFLKVKSLNGDGKIEWVQWLGDGVDLKCSLDSI